MQDIDVKISGINVTDFSTKEGSVELEILFNTFKTIKQLDDIDDPNEIAHDLIVEIRRKIKAKYQNDDSDDILGGIVNVRIEDEDSVINKISMFLAKLSDKVKEVKNTKTSDNYLDIINSVKSLKLEL